MNGILNILKPPGMTSHDVVAAVRKKLGIRRVGHTGTLDPDAAGVLPICIGKATRVSQYLQESNKGYRVEMILGITTNTQDISGDIIQWGKLMSKRSDIEDALLSFIGEYKQIPPMYSAIKVKGKRLYELARKGIEVERKARKVKIESINIIDIRNEIVFFDVICSKGTYIRTLCHDVGELLGCGGTMSFLMRTFTGGFHISNAITLEEFYSIDNIANIKNHLKPIDYPLEHLARIDINTKHKKAALNGNIVPLEDLAYSKFLGTETRIYMANRFIGVGTINMDDTDNLYIKFSKHFA